MAPKTPIVADPQKNKTKKDMKKGKGKKKYAKATKLASAPDDGAAPVKKTKKRAENYKRFIHRVLRQIHPKGAMSVKAMDIMNSFCNDIFDKIATESNRLLRTSKHRTLRSIDVETSVKLLLGGGELSRHAVSEASRAVSKFCGKDM
mmetsp:Transcript_36689/g.84414  ORF Transcript_36689/g.84414 Transcript_36689/m.84414 type:complete len:147 (-) Transcript_36689:196-636(-)